MKLTPIVILSQVVYEEVKLKSYVRVVTSLGDINLELHTDQVAPYYINILYLERSISRNCELLMPKSWDQG